MSTREFERLVEQIDPPFWKKPVSDDEDIDDMMLDEIIKNGELSDEDFGYDPY